MRVPQASARDAARGGAPLQCRDHRRLHGRRCAARSRGRRRRGREADPGADRQRRGHARRRQAAGGNARFRRPRGVRRTPRAVTILRSALFALGLALLTPPYALLALATFPLPRLTRYRIISGWSRHVIRLARVVLGIDWRVEGRENLPPQPAVILSKHQSAWETLAFQLIFPPHVH